MNAYNFPAQTTTDKKETTRQPKASKPVIRLYTREECCLCDDMKKALIAEQKNHDFSIELHNIDQQLELREKLNDYIPVIMWGQDVVCYHHFDVVHFRQTLGFT